MSLYDNLAEKKEKLFLMELVYVGMPITAAFAKKELEVVGVGWNR